MAVFKSTTFGKISGRFGDAVATQSKSTGKNYLRVASVPTNPRTDKQVAHRAKFGFINSTLRAFYPIYKTTFGGNVGIRYAINLAFKKAIIGEYPDFAIDYAMLSFSEGALYKTEVITAEKSEEGKIKLDWDATILVGSNADDVVNLIFYNENSNQAMMLSPNVQRSAETTTVDMPGIWKGAIIHCWIYFNTANGVTKSESQYINSVEM